jgi:hypothetical protein
MAQDYNIPGNPLGKYGRMRLAYIKNEKKALFRELKQSGKLQSYLYDIDEQAADMLFRIEENYIKRNPLPSGDDFMAVVRARNTAHSIAEEFVLHDLIYC